MKKLINNLDEFNKYASNFAKTLKKGDIICMHGEMSAGKTTFTKQLAKALKIEDTISSPTFNILKIYNTGEITLYHYDLYRLDEDSFDYELEEYLYMDGISVIEWPLNVETIIPKERIDIIIKIKEENKRSIEIIKRGKKYE